MDEAPDSAPSRWRWAAAGVAAVLVLAVVGALMLVRLRPAPTTSTAAPTGQVGVLADPGFACLLPVAAYAGVATVAFPGGAFTLDTTVKPGNAKGSAYGYSYSVPLHRWVPVQTQWLAPDGRSYAYATQTTGVPGQPPTAAIHVVDIASGRDRQIWQGEGNASIAGLSGGTVYYTLNGYLQAAATGPPANELWAIDTAGSGAVPRRVGPNPPDPAPARDGPSPMFAIVAGGYAWTTGYTKSAITSPPSPPPGAPPGYSPPPFTYLPNRLLRMDLKTGAVSTYFTAPGSSQSVALLGFDGQGHPVVTVQAIPVKGASPPPQNYMPGPPSVLLLTGTDQSQTISSGSDEAFRPTSAAGDGHGVWFGSPGSIWLYTSSAGLRKIATLGNGLFPVPTPFPGSGVPTPMLGGSDGSPPPGKPTMPPGYPTGAPVRVVSGCA